METLLAHSVLPTRTTMTFSSDLLPLGSSGCTANPSAGFYSLKFWVVLVNCFHVSQSSILLQCLWREALLSTISIVPSKLVSFVNWVRLVFIHHRVVAEQQQFHSWPFRIPCHNEPMDVWWARDTWNYRPLLFVSSSPASYFTLSSYPVQIS